MLRNWQHKQKQNTDLIKRYVAFLPEAASFEDQLKLSTEIGRLNTQNIAIDNMTVKDYKDDYCDFTINKTSNANN